MRPVTTLAFGALALVAACQSSAPTTASTSAPTLPAPPPPDGGAAADASSSPAADAGPSTTPSCTGGPGAGRDCGTGEDCCASLPVPGGTHLAFGDAAFPTTVSPFALDAFEVTAGRFRAYVEATGGDLRGHAPAEGAGAHPHVVASGWRSAWNAQLPTSRADVDAMLGPEGCQVGANLDDHGAVTWWTPAIAAKRGDRAETQEELDRKPIVCIPWAVLFSFCVWDGGRLPTNAEWDFAAAGGEEQRPFPWGAMAPTDVARIGEKENLSVAPLFGPGKDFVVASLWEPRNGANVFPDLYLFTWGGTESDPHDGAKHIAPVGSLPRGRGRWGHSDLAGNVYEWMLDEGPIRPGPCQDCANVRWPAPDQRDPDVPVPFPLHDFEDRWFVGGARAIRGGAWDNALGLSNTQTRDEIATYTSYPVLRTYRSLGGRCARDVR